MVQFSICFLTISLNRTCEVGSRLVKGSSNITNWGFPKKADTRPTFFWFPSDNGYFPLRGSKKRLDRELPKF